MRIKFHNCAALIAACLLSITSSYFASAEEPTSTTDSRKQLVYGTSETNDKAQLEREKMFGELMSGAVLEGHFTANKSKDAKPNDATNKNDPYGNNEENGKELKLGTPEKYTLGKVTKLKDNLWNFETRIQYGKHDVPLTLAIRVVWSGDTPVITLDKFPVPGFGTFTCRVMIFNNQYAGMWGGGDHGGLMFGKITRPEKESSNKKGSEKPIETKSK